MGVSALCIRRPVFATVLSLIIVLLGLAAYQRLTVREYPNIDPPVVTVRTDYPGASARIIETQVTQVLEDSLAGIEGIDYISSTSREGTSFVNIRFNARSRSGRGGERRARPDEPGARPAPGRDRRADHPEGRGRRRADHLSVLLERPPLAAGAHRLRRPLRQEPDPDPAGRRRGADLRRAALRHADLARPAPARGLRPHAAGRRGRAARPEHRGPGGRHREPVARVLGRLGDRPHHAGGIRRHRPRSRRAAISSACRMSAGPSSAPRTTRPSPASTGAPRSPWAWSSRRPPTRSTYREALQDRLPALTDNLPQGMQVEIAYDKSVFIAESITT